MNYSSFFQLLIVFGLIAISISRPPGQSELQQKQSAQLQFIDYFEDFFPVLLNSTKLHENYQYEKKKYLTTVLGLPSKRRMKMAR